MANIYDVVIIGGGPAGVAAGVYAARKKMNALVVADAFAGQSLVSADIQNWIGTKSISGYEWAKNMEEHLKSQEGIQIQEGEKVTSVEKSGENFIVKTSGGKSFETKTVLVGSGSRRRKLGVPGEEKLDGKGVAYCSICDAPLFKDKEVAVVGGGNAGLEAVIDLLPYASKIYLVERNYDLKGDAVTQAKIKANPKVQFVYGVNTLEILGETGVTGLKYRDIKTGKEDILNVGGVFIEIGAIPNTDFVKGLVEFNKINEIVVNHKTQRSSVEGIWAAGDASDVIYKQNNISAGDAIKAILDIHDYLSKK